MMVKFILDGGAQKGLEKVEPQVREQGSLQDGHSASLQDGNPRGLQVGEQGGHFLMRIIHICLVLFSYYCKIYIRWSCSTRVTASSTSSARCSKRSTSVRCPVSRTAR